ncbi:uncharacterized protein LOC121287955 [Carcharodon carcharias]|uniref:uncharacterized protein LOC121287955 n=1 Tax=Carcharodon carcharias TaxID=13397 RepID=UPI001B7F3CFE|nr:uncharacterized protein LOC121287955 [Carcharodon carcharias]
MRLQAVLCLWAAVSSFARNLAKPRPGNLCVAVCTGTNQLNYQKGFRYTYKYTTATNSFLQGSSHESSGVAIECLVNIDVLDKCHHILTLRNTQIKGSMSNEVELLPGQEKLRASLEKHPLQFSFQDGIIPEICPSEGEETWALNIKRGILSILQDSYTVNKQKTVEEVDISGKCLSVYKVQGSLLMKFKDLNRCFLRSMAVTSLQSVVLPDSAILDSQLECMQNYKGGIIEMATCNESNVFRPFSKEGKGAKTEILATMKLLKVEEALSMPRVELKAFHHSTLLFERERGKGKKAGYSNAVRVAEAVRQLCLTKGMTFESADLFMSLVFDLRSLSIGALQDLWQRALFKCRDNWQPLVDTLPACGTEACISFLTEIILSQELDEDRADAFMWSLAFIPEPTAPMVAAVTALLKSPDARTQTFLGVSSLVHNFCSKNNTCQVIPEVQEVMKILEGYVQGNCRARESERKEKVLMSLKAIGNAGLGANAQIPTLNECVQSKTNLLEVRLAAVYAFRRIPCEADRTVLVQLYQTADEDVELRIASYYILMKCPSDQLFETVGLTLQNERSSQVGSFVWTHLSQLMETNDPLKQQIKETLPNYIVSKDFDLEHWKYSSYVDATFQSEPFPVGANAEAALIFSPRSFLPRSAMANFTIYVMGYAVNLLEVGIRVENAEYLVQKIFGHRQAPFMDSPKNMKNSGRKWRMRNPSKSSIQTAGKKEAVRRHAVSKFTASKQQVEKPRFQKANQSCQNVDYNRIYEIEAQFAKRMAKKKKKLTCGLSMKIFGNELSFIDCSNMRTQIKQYSLDMAEIAIKLLKGQEVQYNRRTSLATEELTFSSISGLPIRLAVNASAATNIKIKGNVDLKQRTDFIITGFIKPSAHIHVSIHMGVDGTIGKAGLEWVAGMRTLMSLDGGIQLKKGQDLKVFLNTPQDTMEIIDISSRLYTTNPSRKEEMIGSHDRREARTCSEEEFSRQIGWQICSEMSYPLGTSGPAFPLSGPAEASVMLIKRDKGLQQYLLEAAYSYVTQKNSWFPTEAVLHFFMGTPQSVINRDVAIDFQLNYSKRKLSAKIIHPKKAIKIDGEIRKMKHSRTGLLEVLIDDKDLYYVKGWTSLQSLDGEQMFFSKLEAKFTKHGSPIILSGNVTRVPGQKIALFVSLNNVMQETATVSVRLEQKVDEKQKQYTIEADTYLPRILGCQIIGFLQQRGTSWSSTLRGKYGLFGDALNLRHECNMAQKIKRETSPTETYKLQVQHEFHCTQITSYNHKLHLQHEENESRTHTQLEINYGKHWDEINNRKKIFITQLFKNDSSASLTNYFMEFTLQIPEKQIHYRTQLQHSHLHQGYAESNTHVKVLYNDKIPFQAGIQWKDTSKPKLKKWEGSLKLDTPWLYLQTSHKLNQPHIRAYQSSVEITAAKAISVKNLVIWTYYKNKGNKLEGRIHIYTPSTTYVKASTLGHITENLFRSHSEVVSLWNLPVKNKILVESKEKLKSAWFWLKHQKKEFNFTANYMDREEPKKKRSITVMALWTDNKSPPLVMQLNGQIEELKREKMLFQNRALIQFRHPFKLPVPQNTLLQETFTVDKRKKHYVLEVKALVNEKEETIHTLILGYQPEKPYICVALAHPYNAEVIPKNMEVCFRTKTDHIAKFEAEATVRINKRDALKFRGRYQNKSTDTDCWYLVHFDTDHSLQIRVPHTLILDGELFTMQSKHKDFNYGANCKFIVNKLDTSQFSIQWNGSSNQMRVYSQFSHPYQSTIPYTFQTLATAKNYGESNYNGTFYLHSNGKDLMVTEFDVVNESKRSVRTLGVKAALHQSFLTGPKNSQFQVTARAHNSRYLVVSSLQLDEKAFDIDLMGLKEYQECLILSMAGTVQHNMNNGQTIPQFLHVDANLKQQNNTNEGNLNIEIDDILYRLHLQNNNSFSDSTAHDLIVTLIQNGSLTIPARTEFKGHLELGQESRVGQACWQTDDKSICFQLFQVTKANQTKVTCKVAHNLEELITTGLPADGRFSLNYVHMNKNRAVMIEMQSGSKRIQASVEMERTFTGTPIYQLTIHLLHSVEELEKFGLPFSSTGSYHYQNLRNGYTANVSVKLEKQHLRTAIEQKSTARTGEVFLFFNHDIEALSKRIPATIQVNCSGEASQKLLLGHCSGAVAGKPFESAMPTRFSLNGTMRTDRCEADFSGHLQMDNKFARLEWQTIWTPIPSIDLGFRHSVPLLLTVGIPNDNRLLIRTGKGTKHEASVEFTVGKCSLRAVGDVKVPGNKKEGMSTDWSASLMNRCLTLERVGVPQNLETNGSLDINSCNIAIKTNMLNNGKTAEFHLETSCNPKYTVQGVFKHTIPQLSNRGLPSESQILLSATKGAKMEGSFLLQSGNCKVRADGNLNSGAKAEWMWVTETDCEVLQNFKIPAQSQCNGSIQVEGCKAELLTNIQLEGNSATLELNSECDPKVNIEVIFEHTLPMLKGIPEHNKLFFTAERHLKSEFELDLKMGTCNLLASGGLQVKNKTELNFLINNKCKKLQDLAVPLKINGSGYIVINGVNFASQIQINIDQTKLEGLITLKSDANKHEINASLFHNIDGASQLGIPGNTVVALTAEKQGDTYMRSIRFIVDSKQIIEDLTFVLKTHHISLSYKLTHNLELLKTLFIDEDVDIQIKAEIQGLTPNLEGSVQIVLDGEKSVAYAFNTYVNDGHFKLIIRNSHNSESLATVGYPEEIVLVLIAQRTDTKISSMFDIQYDSKNMKLILDASRRFTMGAVIEFNIEVQHTILFIKKLGVPFSIKVDCYGMLKDTDVDASLKLKYEPVANVILLVEGRNQHYNKELQLIVLQNIPALRYLPAAVEIATKVNYSAHMINGTFNIMLDENKLNAFTILTIGGSGYSEIFEMTHTFAQLKAIPKQLVCNTVYQKIGRTYMLSHNATWEDKELGFLGSYSGSFPKIFGRHETRVNFFHPFAIPLPQQLQLRMSLSHSLFSHQDDIVINWDYKDQVVLLVSLNLDNDRLESRANLQHPFQLTLKKFELQCLSERKEKKYNQKAHVAWNGGQPIDLKFTLEYKLESNLTALDTCVDFSSGQLQPLLLIQSLHGCGSAKHTQNSFTESVELHWDDKKINQSFEYQNNRPMRPDNIWIAVTFSNVIQSSCGRQGILGRIQTDYRDQLNHYLKVAFCNMSNSIKLSGKHQRNKGEVILSSQTRVSLSSDEKHDMVLGMSLRNGGQADMKNYSLDMQWKASEASHLGLLGKYTASALKRRIVLEGKIDYREAIKLASTHEKGCQQYYTGYTNGGSDEEGVELAFCSNGRGSAKAELYHSLNQTRKGELGHVAVTVVNKSMQSVLRVTAQGCGHLVTRTEAKLSEIVLQFKNQLLKKLKDFDLRVWKFRKNVGDTTFLYETCGWMLKASQKTADAIRNGGRMFRQMWKLSRVRQMVLHVVPLYLEKIQETLQQLQGELQKPVATLKDAYYDVTLKELDQEWKLKTEEYLEKIQSFIPTVVQDTWLLQSVPRVLYITKQAFDLTTQQVTRWAEAKIAKATSKIHKPLANLYKYSPEDCSVVVNVPLLSMGERLLDVANITNYLVESKLIKTLRSLYNINPIAEYYRLKHRIMDSPFEHQALLIGNKHYVTFDGKMYDFASKCSFLLAKDFQRNTFTVLLNHESDGRNSLRVEMNRTIIDIYPGVKVEENCKASELPLVKNGVTIRKDLNEVKVSNQNGVIVSCNMQREICSLTLPGWYHGLSAGLFGTNDNEAGNEFTLPNHSQTENVEEFAQKWQIDAPCHTTGKKVKLCFGSAFQYICKMLFKGAYSPLRNCFRVVDPVPFYDMCLNDMCESSDLQPGCNLAAAFVHLCNRNFVPLEIPSQCVAGKDSDSMQNDDVVDNKQWLTVKPADVLFIIEERDCNKPIVTKLPSLINSLVETFKKQGITDVKFGFIGFGDVGVHEQHLLTVKREHSTSSSWHLEKELGSNLTFTRNISLNAPAAVKLVAQWPFRKEATKSAILLTCSSCHRNDKSSENTLQNLLTSSGITLHVLKDMKIQLKNEESDATIVGLDDSNLFRVSGAGAWPSKTLRHHIVLPAEDRCLSAAIKSGGAVFDSSKFINQGENFLQLFSFQVTKKHKIGKCEICQSSTG